MSKKQKFSAKLRRLRPYVLAAAIAAAAGIIYPLLHGIFSFSLSLGAATLACLITFGLVSFETFVYEKKLRQMHIGKAIAAKTLVYSSVLAIAYLILNWVAQIKDPDHASSLSFQSLFIFAAVASVTVSSFVTVSHILGQHELIRLILGHYHQPREEKRILFFIDLAGSTTVAEKIGGVPFFNLLNDFFRDLTHPILAQGGEIYKYVGDEVIVSWPVKRRNGNARVLKCFFEIIEEVEQRKAFYEETYGVVPQFRAGAHMGTVVVGELGDFKKEIALMGDAVNTTARIISEAAYRGRGILISQDLLNVISDSDRKGFLFDELGKIPLKGKVTEVPLWGVSALSNQQRPSWWDKLLKTSKKAA